MAPKKTSTKNKTGDKIIDITIKEENTIKPAPINIEEDSSKKNQNQNNAEKKVQTPGEKITPKPQEKKEKIKKISKEKSKGKRLRHETFGIYIYKVLKQVHKDIGISKRSMRIMNSFMNDVYERLASESANLVRYNKKHTLSAREVQSAVKLILPGELAKHAIIEGAKAVNKIASTQKN